MLVLIAEQFNQLSEEKIDLKYLESPEFAELISQILKYSKDNAAEEKASFYAQVIAESILMDCIQIEFIWKSEILKIISDVNIEEFLFLQAIASHSSPQKTVTIKSHIFNKIKKKKLCVSSLLSKGLIEDASIQNISDRISPGRQRALKTEGLIKITELGFEVANYILSTQNNLKKQNRSA